MPNLTAEKRARLHALWASFRERWPVEALRVMTLEQYTNVEKDDSFTYWVEARLNDLGSIWGLNSFKFGIYRRSSAEKKQSDTKYSYTDEYAWRTIYGATRDEAFAAVRSILVALAEAADAGNFEAIDELELMPLYKWKLAFLYQSQTAPTVFPIYTQKALLSLYRAHVDPAAKWSVPMSVRYSSLRDRFKELETFELASVLWQEHQAAESRDPLAWAMDLGAAVPASERSALLASASVANDRVPSVVRDWIIAQADADTGDRLAMIVDGRVRARAKLTGADDDAMSWTQESCDLAWTGPALGAGLLRLPDSLASAIWNDAVARRSVAPAAAAKPAPTARNLVLYGPPGTGKTFATTRAALKLVLDPSVVETMTFETAAMQFRLLQQEGRIEMVTFHQAYGYEEFVEGLRPVLGDESGGDVHYELHPGVFKRIALKAAAAGMRTQADEPTFDLLWSELLVRVRADEDRILESASGNEYVLRTTSQDNFESYRIQRTKDTEEAVVSDARQIASKGTVQVWWEHRSEIGGPESLTYEKTSELMRRARGGTGGHHYTAIWMVYRELLALRDELKSKREEADPTPTQVQSALDRAVPGKVDFAFGAQTRQFVLIIDEINRGNVSKVLGELITLLEPDKRLGMPNELKLPLAYSPKHRFAVPPNLHIVATMNTADRSIALMDVALRRRFDFQEVMPDSAALRDVLIARTSNESLTQLVVELLETVNKRIRFLYDRDHQIGHAYFMQVTDLASLRNVLVARIVPLLQEYFYGRWDRVAAVLGCPYDDAGRPQRGGTVIDGGSYRAPIIEAKSASSRDVLGFASDDYESLVEHSLASAFVSASTPAEIAPYLLGILEVDAAVRKTREAQLTAITGAT